MTAFTEQRAEGGWCVIAIRGMLDAPGTMAIEEALSSCLAGRSGPVIVDLSEVAFLSSYGLRMLLSMAKALKAAGGQLHLAGPDPRVMAIITLSGCDTIFPIHPTLADAIREMR